LRKATGCKGPPGRISSHACSKKWRRSAASEEGRRSCDSSRGRGGKGGDDDDDREEEEVEAEVGEEQEGDESVAMRQAECRSSTSLAERGEGALEGANQRCGGEGCAREREREKKRRGRRRSRSGRRG
jgi:hypothetical protein